MQEAMHSLAMKRHFEHILGLLCNMDLKERRAFDAKIRLILALPESVRGMMR